MCRRLLAGRLLARRVVRLIRLWLWLRRRLRPGKAATSDALRACDRVVAPGMGQDARRTARRRALIEDGIHPATRFPVTDRSRNLGMRLMPIADQAEAEES